MQSIYDELVKLQELPDAYEEWADYREKLTDFICDETAAGSTALIVGAGRCNDFDLKRLEKHFSGMTLMDRDLAVVTEGLAAQDITLFGFEAGKADISLQSGDIVGINEDVYRKLCRDAAEFVRTGKNGDDMEQLFIDTMRKAYSGRMPYTFTGEYDHVICCGVHSQLNNTFCQIAEVFSHYVMLDMENIFRIAGEENEIIVRKLNRDLYRCSKDGIILAFEKQRIGVQGAIEGAYQAMADIEKNYSVKKEQSIIWPFDGKHGKVYRMKVLSVQ